MQVVILNDGETYTNIRGCVILDIPSDVEDIDQYVKDHYGEGTPVA